MRRWFAYEGVWKSKKDGLWMEEQPPIPDWASPLDFVRFVQIWVEADDLNTVRKHIFWMSLEELELTKSEISTCLQQEGYHPLPDKKNREKGLFSEKQLVQLEDQGLIVPKENRSCDDSSNEQDVEMSDDQQEYDVVQALLSSPQASYEPLSHIQTTEAGRFTAKH